MSIKMYNWLVNICTVIFIVFAMTFDYVDKFYQWIMLGTLGVLSLSLMISYFILHWKSVENKS